MRTLRVDTVLVSWLTLASGALACDSREQEANETALLLQRVQEYTDASDADQFAQLQALRRLAPASDRVRDARDACLAAYDLVEKAEAQHAEARRMLGEVTSGQSELGTARARIEARIRSSNEAIDGAKPKIRRCTRLLSDLKREHHR